MTFIRKAKPKQPKGGFDAGQKLVSRFAAPIERLWLRIADDLRATIPMSAINEAVRSGRPEAVLRLIPANIGIAKQQRLDPSVESIERALLDAAHAAYLDEERRLGIQIGSAAPPPPGGGEPPDRRSFEAWQLRNPKVKQWASREAAKLVTQVSDSTKEGIRRAIIEAYEEGIPTGQAAANIKRSIGLLPRQTKALTRQIATQREAGVSSDKIERSSAATVRRMLRERAEMIARTEMNAAQNRGRQASWEEAIAEGDLPASMKQRWDSGVEDPTCEICLELHGKEAPIGGQFESSIVGMLDGPPAHPHCLPGDALVLSRSGIAAVSVRMFEGDIFVIRTASGRELACTPHHPVLTDRGWILACRLNMGDNVISDGGREWVSSTVDHQTQDVPARIHDLADAFRGSPGVLASEVETAPPHFHGDGMDGEVAVIYADRELGFRSQSAIMEHLSEAHFSGRNAEQPLPSRDRAQSLAFPADGPASDRIMRGSSKPGPLLGGSLRHAKEHPLTSVPGSDSLPLEPVGDNAPTHPESLGQRLDGSAVVVGFDQGGDVDVNSRLGLEVGEGDALLAKPGLDGVDAYAKLAAQIISGATGPVFPDEIVHIESNSWHGHVYNLETGMGFYSANGIITHNCRCSVRISFEDD